MSLEGKKMSALETFTGTDGIVSGAQATAALEQLFSDTGSDA